jgi:UDP-N-acetylglucosamine--N-acetylmuramyl-(pentapeptide) pyrophosphoryl-undecaprenol N-acetylglucosamine transferase
LRKIYFAVFGSGLGHATRVLDISGRVSYGETELLYSSFDEGLDYLTAHGMRTLDSPSVDVKWNSDGSLSTKDTIIRFPQGLMSFSKQVDFESKHISKFRPDVVVSDSRLSAIFAAKSRSFPVVTILNQFKVLFPPRFRGKMLSNFWERLAGDLLGLFWSLSDNVCMTDLPPPYTIGEANISATDVSNIVNYVGFTSPRIETSEEKLQKIRETLGLNKRVVFIQISGPNASKKYFIKTALNAAGPLSKEFNIIVSLGYPGGSPEPKPLANGGWVYEWCPVKDELFILSSVLVARSGHGTIGQCVNAGKPAVLVPIQNHSEQLANAEKFQQLGLGISIRSEDLSMPKLVEAVGACANDPKYSKKAEELRQISLRYDGVERVAEIINSYR